ncbi:MAG: 16S rRNA (uracil(1498)-N(3))-methyltransferase [Pyrinomonadaceae bacterium]
MRRRFYAPPDAFAPDLSFVALAADEARHLRDVLRLRTGDEAFVFDGEGREFACRVEDFKRNDSTIKLAIVKAVEPLRLESTLDLTLAIALLKGEKFDLVVQKATELGVTRIVPIISQRADVRLRDAKATLRHIERLRRIAIEAAKQSGRARVPKISMPVELLELFETAARDIESILRVMFSERNGRGFIETFGAADVEKPNAKNVIALVGAEGGWETMEILQAQNAKWHIVTLGGRTLRAETAAIVAVTLLQHRFGDVR